jgi:hypothetical protein
MNVLAATQNLGVKLEKVALTSRAELAEPSSLAYQRIVAVVYRVTQLRKWGKLRRIREVSRSKTFFEVPVASENLNFLS